MHREHVAKEPRGAGWYILLEDGEMLEGRPFPSEEATWAEIALRAPQKIAEQEGATSGPPKPPDPEGRQGRGR